jgi:hypothetical protein
MIELERPHPRRKALDQTVEIAGSAALTQCDCAQRGC